MIRVKSVQDFLAGLLFVAFGVIGAWIAQNYPFGTAVRMGPGYLPVVLSWCMIVLGALIMGRSLVIEGPGFGALKLRPLVFVLGCVLVYALTIEKLGLVISTFLTTVICAYADTEMRWVETILLGVALSVFCVVTFVYGLSLPLSIWPD